MKKTKKKILTITSGILIMVVISGCNKNNEQEKIKELEKQVSVLQVDNNKDTTLNIFNNTTEEIIENKISNEKIDQGVKTFLKNLIDKNYDEALKCAYIPDKCFIEPKDIEWYLTRSQFNKINRIDYKDYEIKVDILSYNGYIIETQAFIKSKSNKDNKIIIPVKIINEDNKYLIDVSDFYYEDFYITAPGEDIKVLVNGIELADEYITKKECGEYRRYYEYKLPYVTKNDIEITLECDYYTYNQKISTCEGNEDEPVLIYKSLDNSENILKQITKLWNNACIYYKDNNSMVKLRTLISKDADVSICEDIKDGFKHIEDMRISDIKMTKCVLGDKESYWISKDEAIVNFNYELSWNYNNPLSGKQKQTMKNVSNIILKFENGEFKIKELQDNTLFSYATAGISEW